MSERASEWLRTYTPILGGSEPLRPRILTQPWEPWEDEEEEEEEDDVEKKEKKKEEDYD